MTTDEDREAMEAEMEMDRRARAVQREAGAMAAAFVTLQPLDFNARRRALRWLAAALDNAEVPF